MGLKKAKTTKAKTEPAEISDFVGNFQRKLPVRSSHFQGMGCCWAAGEGPATNTHRASCFQLYWDFGKTILVCSALYLVVVEVGPPYMNYTLF